MAYERLGKYSDVVIYGKPIVLYMQAVILPEMIIAIYERERDLVSEGISYQFSVHTSSSLFKKALFKGLSLLFDNPFMSSRKKRFTAQLQAKIIIHRAFLAALITPCLLCFLIYRPKVNAE